MSILNIVPTWLPSDSLLQLTCKLVITNLGDKELPASSLLQFNIGKYQTALMPTTGFDDFSQTDNVVKGHLTNAILPKQTTVLNLPIKLGSTIPFPPTLPAEFVMNDAPVHPIDDKIAPTTPQNLQLVTAGVNSLTMKWDPSTDNLSNVVYSVTYQQGPAGEVHKLTTEQTQATLTALVPGAEYQVSVVASDLAGNTSFHSFPLMSSTLPQLPNIPWGSLNPLPAVDTVATPTPNLEHYIDLTNVKNYVLGFIKGVEVPVETNPDNPTTKVVPAFGGLKELVDSNSNATFPGDARVSNYLKEGIAVLREKGGDVVMSFGGLNNTSPPTEPGMPSNLPMESYITDVAEIVQNYNDIIKNYDLKYLDFSFPQDFLNNQDGVSRFVAAISQVMCTNPNLKTAYTLPTSGTSDLMGFDESALNLLNLLNNAGIRPSLINLLPLDSNNNFKSIKQAIEGLTDNNPNHLGVVGQLLNLYTGLSKDQATKMLSVSPTFGANSAGQNFDLPNQVDLNLYAIAHGLKLSGWNANNDLSGATGLPTGAFLRLLAELDPVLPPVLPRAEQLLSEEVALSAEVSEVPEV